MWLEQATAMKNIMKSLYSWLQSRMTINNEELCAGAKVVLEDLQEEGAGERTRMVGDRETLVILDNHHHIQDYMI